MHSTSKHFVAVIAFLLPPAAVWIETGWCSADGGINLLLCLLGWLPGIAHAMYIVYRKPPPCCDEEGQYHHHHHHHHRQQACCHPAQCSQHVAGCSHHHAVNCNHHHHVTPCTHAPIDQQPVPQPPSQQPTYQPAHASLAPAAGDRDSSDTITAHLDGQTEVLPVYKV